VSKNYLLGLGAAEPGNQEHRVVNNSLFGMRRAHGVQIVPWPEFCED
jgi:hypothetical protein